MSKLSPDQQVFNHIKHFLLVTFVILSSSIISIAQPANDDCTGATNLGTLPTPVACPGSGLGAAVNVAGTLVGATPESTYIYQTSCSGAGGTTQASPADDVWYSFVASGYQAVITVTSTFANPNISMYAGSCASLGGGVGGCAVGTGGTVTLTVEQMVKGTTYYLQISGNVGQTGTFNLSVKNNIDCSNCMNSSTLTATPLPVNGSYLPGQTVHFCYHVDNYAQVNTNWLHGVQVALGAGWNAASFVAGTITPFATVNGSWAYYASGITDASSQHWPAGWYFDEASSLDGNPGNNYGDVTSASGSAVCAIPSTVWNFCFDITVAAGCSPGSDLSVTYNTSGDGESGTWTSLGCVNDPPTIFHAVGACCAPTMASTATTCVGNNGTATATPVGTSGPYDYSWANSGGTVSSTTGVAGANTVTGLAPGTYTVSITNVYNCLATNTVVVANGGTNPATPTAGSNTPICSGATLNLTAASITNGVYTWAGPNSYTSSGVQNPSITNATTLASGTYTVTVTIGGCTNTSSTVVTVNPLPTGSTTSVAATCGNSNGSLNVTTAFNSYVWNTTPAQTTQTATGLAQGTYTVTVTDANGCTASINGVVTNSSGPNITGTPNGETCTGNNDGSVNITVTGGVTPYTYAWSNTAATQNLAAVAGGTYTVTVSDNNGCSSSKSFVVTTHALVSATATTTPEYCSKGNGTATGVGSLGSGGPYTYIWSNSQNTATISNLVAGTYTVTVSDSHCTTTTTVVVGTVAGPTVAINNIVDAKCALANGSAIATATGGTGTCTYAWSNAQNTANLQNVAGGTYTVTVTDTKGCTATNSVVINTSPVPTAVISATVASVCTLPNGSITVTAGSGTSPYTYVWNPTAQTTPTATGILGSPPATYAVTVTDAIGCTATTSGVVTNNPGPVITGTPNGETCTGNNDGSVNITVIGGVTPYTFTWSNTAGTQNLAAVAGGTYTVTVSDNNGCSSSKSFVVTTHAMVSATATSTPEYCSKGNGTATGVGSLGSGGPYTYLWNNAQSTTSISNLIAGTYTVTVSDSHCTTTTTVVVGTVAGPTASTNNVINTTCGLPNGSVQVTPAGGTPGYTYLWSNAGTNATITNVLAGTYNVTVTDAAGCTTTAVAVIGGTTVPTAAVTSIVPANCGYLNGSITVTVNPGTPPYTYVWSPSVQTTQTAAGIPSGSYIVTVTDAAGCTTTASGTVPQLAGPTATTTTQPEICSHGDGTATVTAGGGHGVPYTYLWSNGQTTQTATNLSAGTYSVVVNDGGCNVSASANISNIPGPHAYFTANPTVLTIMDGPVTFSDLSTGNVVTWDWTLGDDSVSSSTQFLHSYPNVGTYPVTLIVIDNNGCKDTVVDTIKVRDIYTFYVPNCFTPTDDKLNDWFYPQGVNWDPNYFEMYVFDRWGNLMFKSLDQTKDKWNGTLNNSGNKDDAITDIYVYLIRIKELNGPKHQYIGKITLLK